MSDSVKRVELVVRAMAQAAIDNESYFGDLDAVVGDGDFGYSIARGFEKVLESFDDIDRTDVGTFLKQVGVIISSRVGGTSGPLWGTAFMRAGGAVGQTTTLDGQQVLAMLRAATDGIMKRGQAQVGDKTLLDALVPAIDTIERALGAGDSASVVSAGAQAARLAAEATSQLVAKRGRASYTGERSRGSVDAGAMAIAVMAERINEEWCTGIPL